MNSRYARHGRCSNRLVRLCVRAVTKLINIIVAAGSSAPRAGDIARVTSPWTSSSSALCARSFCTMA